MIVLTSDIYNYIINFIDNFNGLTIDCKHELKKLLPNVNIMTISSIISQDSQNRIKYNHHKLTHMASKLLKTYEKNSSKKDTILNMAIRHKISPLSFARILLLEKYKHLNKNDITQMIKNPNLIEDTDLSINISYCMYNDIQNGILLDVSSRYIGEEYEIRMKQFARDVGMSFYDENDLRRTGFDKTPDLKLAIPCLYKGNVINWIESKALFGDFHLHRKYIKNQLTSYGNRFGAGIVIYWFGYLDIVETCKENSNFIYVLNRFPNQSELEFLNFDNINDDA